MKLKNLLLAVTSATVPACAQGVLFTPTAQMAGQTNGAGVLTSSPGAYVTVCLFTDAKCTPATVYKDQALTRPLAQTFRADTQGNVVFRASPGNYNYTVTPADGSAPQSYLTGGGNGQVSATGNVINLSATGMGDYGARIVAQDAAYAGVPATFVISTPGTISTPFTLSPFHDLQILAPITCTATTSSVTTDNTIVGSPDAVITFSPSANLVSGAATGSKRIRIKDLHVVGKGGTLFGSTVATQDISIAGNNVQDVMLYYQGSASVTNPSVRLTVTGNTVTATLNNTVGVLSYGAMQDAIITGNHMTGNVHGVELYANTAAGVGASGYPLKADIATSGIRNNLIGYNTFENITGGSCVWTSVADRTTMIGNTCNVCGDVGFDVEGSSNSLITGNHVSQCANGDLAQFYSGYDNLFLNNTVTVGAEAAFSIRNASLSPLNAVRTSFVGNHVLCLTDGMTCSLSYFEASDRTLVKGNVIHNAVGTSYAQYSSNMRYEGNVFDFDVMIQATSNPPLVLPNMLGGSTSTAVGNTFWTTVAQPNVAAIAAAASDFNASETYSILGNNLYGPWAIDVAAHNSAGNAQFPIHLVLRNNQYASGVVSVGSGVTKISTGNYTAAGATAQ